MELLDQYLTLQQSIYDYFGYKEDWRLFPMQSYRESVWELVLDSRGGGTCWWADSDEELRTQEGNVYQAEIFTYAMLPRWVYRGAEYTAILLDTRADGNFVLGIFTNANERHGVLEGEDDKDDELV